MAKFAATIDLSDSQGSEDVLPQIFYVKKSPHISAPKTVLGKRSHFNINDSEEEEDHIYDTFPAAQRIIIDEAITLLASICSQCSRDHIRNAVCDYCTEQKGIKVVPLDNIVDNVVEMLMKGSVTSPMNVSSSASTTSPTNAPQAVRPPVVLSPWQEILCIFPDAKESFVEAQLAEHGDVAAVIERMADVGYEKRPKVTTSTTEAVKDFKSSSWETSASYRDNALLCLYAAFPYLHKNYVKKEFVTAAQHYYHTTQALHTALGVPPIVYPISALEQRRLTCLVRDKRAEWGGKGIRVVSNVIIRGDVRVDITDAVLLQELHWMQTEKHREQEDNDREAAERLNEEIAAAEGGLMECGCCYSDAPFEKMVQCSEGHLFCKTCLQHYAEQTLFGDGKTTLKCMNSSDNCEGYFAESFLASSLSAKVFAKYQESIAIEAIKAAKLTLVECYDCKFSVEMGEDSGNILTCPDCGKQTCKLCGEVEHIPLKCSEVEKKGATDARLTIEEAMTKARLRECHKCKTRFFKTEGCNKMTCTCGALICYLCRKDITPTGYKHFCQIPHCNHKECGGCKLFSDAVEDDRQAMLDAGIKAKGDAGDEVTVDVAKLLEDSGPKQPQFGMPHIPQMMQQFEPPPEYMFGMQRGRRGGRRGRR